MESNDLSTVVLETIKKIEERIREIRNNDLRYIESLYDFEKLNELLTTKSTKDNYLSNMKTIEELDLVILTKKIEELENMIELYQNIHDNYWSEYNDNYRTHIKNKLEKILNDLISKRVTKTSIYSLMSSYKDFYNSVLNINTNKDILELFSHGSKNYVLFGKNGSGKTRLLNYVKNNYFSTNSYVIPSDKVVKIGNTDMIDQNSAKKNDLANLFTSKDSMYYFSSDFLIYHFQNKIVKELQNKKTIVIDEDGNIKSLIQDKFLKIYESLSTDRKIIFDIDKYQIRLYNDDLNIEEYDIKDGSDGEKSIIQFIMYILLCPENSFVFIDEPESHFNSALLNELFNILERERSDMIFIYCTHNVDFIELRENASLLYLEQFDGKDWKIKEYENYEEINVEHILNIIGTKNDILFIEGEKGSLDFKIYNALFDNFKVISLSSCENIVEHCRLLNEENVLNFNRKAYGIIDNDFKNEEAINKYKQNNIYTLKYNEIENMLLSPCILEYICNKMEITNLEGFKKEVIKMAQNGKQGIIQDYINKTFSKYQKTVHLKYNGDINNFTNQIDTTNEANRNSFMKELQSFIKNLDEDLLNESYENIIQRYPHKGFISCLSSLSIRKELYIEWVVILINKDDEFKKKIKTELFDDFFDKK